MAELSLARFRGIYLLLNRFILAEQLLELLFFLADGLFLQPVLLMSTLQLPFKRLELTLNLRFDFLFQFMLCRKKLPLLKCIVCKFHVFSDVMPGQVVHHSAFQFHKDHVCLRVGLCVSGGGRLLYSE